ncbi:hypothetical protein QYE76_062155 [Lolium multiflorum]|uniref:At1g61320/AtMIF1 LRR domain-containing protein n=1 Tax=Lolium multiflorum TaxID=4521 RepID=A0AAD8S376_LOLMU|nr:hypothetical protein QYE76_062155 [Lolium multiflorum]
MVDLRDIIPLNFSSFSLLLSETTDDSSCVLHLFGQNWAILPSVVASLGLLSAVLCYDISMLQITMDPEILQLQYMALRTFLKDILSYIHSLVPLRDAARAACVSHRFRSSWRCFPNLTFNLETLGLNKYQHREDEGRAKNVVESALGLNKHQRREDEGRAKNVVDRVNHILQNHSGVGVRTLELNLRACRDVITADYVESWLKLAVKPGIMELGVYLPSDLAYNFSCSLFSDEATSSLESLFLLCCDFHPTSGTGCWRSLTSVCLSSVRITEEELGCFLASTFALKKLSLSGCNEMVILKIPSLLQHLSFLEVSHCRMVQIIESDAPKLSTFSYVGPPIKISFGDSSVVKNMYVSSSSDSGIVQFARTRLPSIASNLQTLTLSTYREAFSTPMVPDKFPHLKNLDIYLTGRDNFRGYDFFSLVSFLEASPALEYFNLFAGEHGNLRRDSILGDSSREMRRVPGFHHDSLKRLCITGFCSAKSMFELICQVLENTPSLQVLVLDTTLGFDSVFVPPGKCHIMGKEALDEANRAVEAFRMHVEGKVPSSVGFMVWEPCKRERRELNNRGHLITDAITQIGKN